MELITTAAILAVSKKILGKTFDIVSDDIAKLYQKGRDKIIEKASKKIKNSSDGRSTNLRVTRDVFWNGSFTDESICAEYFGGILASSRSDNGDDDTGVYYVDLIKSLSSQQLKLHYLIYRSFNKLFIQDTAKEKINPAMENELSSATMLLLTLEVVSILGEGDIGRDLHAIRAKGLIGFFRTRTYDLKDGKTKIPYLEAKPSPLGIQLYAVANNRLNTWRDFVNCDFGDFEQINLPKFFGKDIYELLENAGFKHEIN